MLDERQVIELVRRVDPVEDLGDLPDPRLTAAEVLGVRSLDELATTGPKTHTTRQFAGLPIWRGTAIATATTVLVLLAVAVGLLVARSQSEEVASPVPTTTAAAVERRTSVPTFSWQASEPLGVEVEHIEAFDGGFVALVSHRVPFPTPHLLASPDGLSWAPLADQPTEPHRLAAHGGWLYAGTRHALLERIDSIDGAWEQVPLEGGGSFQIQHVVSSDAGVVVYAEGSRGEHRLWRLDGDAFELVPIETDAEIDIPTDMTALPPNGPTGLGEPFSIATITSIDSLSDGFVAAVSVHVEGTDTTRVLRFRSSDGIEWEPFEGPLAGRINLGQWLDFAGYNDAIIATAHYGSWLLENEGSGWQSIDLEIGNPLEATPFGWVYAIGGRFFGTEGVAITIDGREPTIALADRGAVTAIAADDRRLVVVDGDVIWVGEILE